MTGTPPTLEEENNQLRVLLGAALADSERIDKLERISRAATTYREGVTICTNFKNGVMLINPSNMRAAIDAIPFA